MSMEIAKANAPGTVKLFAGKRVIIEGAVLQIESVDMRLKKLTMGVVNIDAARAMFQKTTPADVSAPKLSEKQSEPPKPETTAPEAGNPVGGPAHPETETKTPEGT